MNWAYERRVSARGSASVFTAQQSAQTHHEKPAAGVGGGSVSAAAAAAADVADGVRDGGACEAVCGAGLITVDETMNRIAVDVPPPAAV